MKIANRKLSKQKVSLIAALVAAISFSSVSVKALTVSQQPILNNRSHQTLNAVGLVIHDTDNPGATAQNNRDYFNRVYVAASAHYFVDWNTAIQTIPENEVAWHAGPTANHRYLSIEMCEPKGHDIVQFSQVYNRTVELAADICKRYGWNASQIFSHYWCSVTFKETDHEDPIAFLREYGKSWNNLVNDIQIAINGHQESAPTYQSNAQSNTVVNTNANVGKFTYANNAKVVGDDLYIRDENGNRIPGRYVSNGDNITVLDISYSKQLALVEYPTASGVRKGYVNNVTGLIKYYFQGQYSNGSTPESAYMDSSLSNRFGSLDPHEKATPLYRQGNKLCVVYSTSKGINTKNGFVDYNDHFNKF